jgi:hypothetical protein
MPFTLTVAEHDPPYLLVEVAGPVALADLCAAADFVASLAQRRGLRRALLRMTDTQPNLAFTEHLQLGSYVAHALRLLERVATVVSVRDRVGTSEKAAQKSGLQLRTFTDLEDARAWLAGDEPAP